MTGQQISGEISEASVQVPQTPGPASTRAINAIFIVSLLGFAIRFVRKRRVSSIKSGIIKKPRTQPLAFFILTLWRALSQSSDTICTLTAPISVSSSQLSPGLRTHTSNRLLLAFSTWRSHQYGRLSSQFCPQHPQNSPRPAPTPSRFLTTVKAAPHPQLLKLEIPSCPKQPSLHPHPAQHGPCHFCVNNTLSNVNILQPPQHSPSWSPVTSTQDAWSTLPPCAHSCPITADRLEWTELTPKTLSHSLWLLCSQLSYGPQGRIHPKP